MQTSTRLRIANPMICQRFGFSSTSMITNWRPMHISWHYTTKMETTSASYSSDRMQETRATWSLVFSFCKTTSRFMTWTWASSVYCRLEAILESRCPTARKLPATGKSWWVTLSMWSWNKQWSMDWTPLFCSCHYCSVRSLATDSPKLRVLSLSMPLHIDEIWLDGNGSAPEERPSVSSSLLQTKSRINIANRITFKDKKKKNINKTNILDWLLGISTDWSLLLNN